MVGYGKDDQVLAGYYMGIPCSVGSTYNFAGNLYNRAIKGYGFNCLKLVQSKNIEDGRPRSLIAKIIIRKVISPKKK